MLILSSYFHYENTWLMHPNTNNRNVPIIHILKCSIASAMIPTLCLGLRSFSNGMNSLTHQVTISILIFRYCLQI